MGAKSIRSGTTEAGPMPHGLGLRLVNGFASSGPQFEVLGMGSKGQEAPFSRAAKPLLE